MKVICHIGTPKTASTFLQNTCAANKKWLHRHGVLYPDMLQPIANHMTLFFASACYIHDFSRDYGIHTLEQVEKFRHKLGNHLKNQAHQNHGKVHTVLLSSENLTGNISGQCGVQNFHDFLVNIFDEIEIVIYLRRQDDSLLSMYGEYLKRGYAGPQFDGFVEEALRNRGMVPYIFYKHILGLWQKSFGAERIKVRIFDRKELVGGDILIDLFDLIFQGDIPDLSELVRTKNDNTGFSAPALEFLRRIHPYIPFRENGAPNQTRQRLQGRIDQLPIEPRPRLSAEQSNRIMKYFEADNEWVRSTFLPDHPAPLFPHRSDQNASSNLGQISLDEFAQFTGLLLK